MTSSDGLLFSTAEALAVNELKHLRSQIGSLLLLLLLVLNFSNFSYFQAHF